MSPVLQQNLQNISFYNIIELLQHLGMKKKKRKIKAVKVGNMHQVQYFNSIEEASIAVTGNRNGMHKISAVVNRGQYWVNVYGWRWLSKR